MKRFEAQRWLVAMVMLGGGCGGEETPQSGETDLGAGSGSTAQGDADGESGPRAEGSSGSTSGPVEPSSGSSTGRSDASDSGGSTTDSGESTTEGAVPQCRAEGPLPILPCRDGYGIETAAGSGRHVDPPMTQLIEVTNLEASGEGSLRACAEATGPRTCVFTVSGAIDLTSNIEVTEPYLTIAGQTAPAPGVSIHGAGIRIETDDVLISHLRIRVGDRRNGPPVHNRDAISVGNSDDPPERVIIDHCSMALSSDEMFTVWYEAGDVTVLDSIMGWPLHDSIHVDEGASGPAPHGYGQLLGQWGARVMLARNFMVHQYGRNPLSRTRELVFVNNVIHNFGNNSSVLGGDDSTFNTFVNDLYQTGVDSNTSRPAIVADMPGGSLLYAEGLTYDGETPADAWDLVELRDPQDAQADAPPTSLVPDVLPVADLAESLAVRVGAWPTHRDSIDEALVSHTLEGGGRIINCVEDDGSERCSANAGGWPVVPENVHTLAVPANPLQDDNGDGYTNLENWLHEQAAALEG